VGKLVSRKLSEGICRYLLGVLDLERQRELLEREPVEVAVQGVPGIERTFDGEAAFP
jgi:hypothetical protein